MAEQNQTTWRERNRQMHVDGTLNYLDLSVTSIAAQRVKFICTRPRRYCPWFELHHINLQEYCDRHGYLYVRDIDWVPTATRIGYVRASDDDLSRERERIFSTRAVMLEQLADCNLLVWLGSDTLVTNMTVRLEDVMPTDAHVALPRSGDCYECDTIIVRNSPEGKSLLEDWTSWMNKDHQVWQQYGDFVPTYAQRQIEDHDGKGAKFPVPFAEEMIAHRIQHDDDVLTAVCDRYPEQAARVYTVDSKRFATIHIHWQPGDYIMHVPGTDDDEKMVRMLRARDHIVR
jgi:hypothetical protein